MPVVHEYTDGSSMYLRSTVDGASVTLHLTDAAAELLTTLGYTDGSTVDWDLLEPLWERDHVSSSDANESVSLAAVFADCDGIDGISESEAETLHSFVESSDTDMNVESNGTATTATVTTSSDHHSQSGGLTAKYSTNTDFSTDPGSELTDTETDRFAGQIEFVDEEFSYGFVTLSDLDESVYLTPQVIEELSLDAGERVSFGIESMDGGLQAVDVSREQTDDATDSSTDHSDSASAADRAGADQEVVAPTVPDVDSANDSESQSDRPTPYYKESIVACPYCETICSSLELIEHVRASDDPSHGGDGAVPTSFDPTTVSVVEAGTDTVVQPPATTVVTADAFTPLCRWCGESFVRYGQLAAHVSSDCECATDEATIENAAVLVPRTASGDVLASADAIEDELPEDVAGDLSVADAPTPIGCPSRWTEDTEDRDDALDSYWLFTDLVTIVSGLRDSAVADDDRLETIGAFAEKQRSLAAEQTDPALLQSYRSVFDAPAFGDPLPTSVHEQIADEDGQETLYLPPGITFDAPDRSADSPTPSQQSVEEVSTDERDAPTDSNGEPADGVTATAFSGDRPSENATEAASVGHSTETALAVSQIPQQVPREVIVDVIETYTTYENARRESSWFHALSVLQTRLGDFESTEERSLQEPDE